MPQETKVAAVECKSGKVAHASRAIAMAAMKQQIDFADWNGRDRKLFGVYRCKTCGLFHVGSEDMTWLRAEVKPFKRKRFRCSDPNDAA